MRMDLVTNRTPAERKKTANAASGHPRRRPFPWIGDTSQKTSTASMKITQIDTKSRRVSLSIKAREVEEDKQAMQEFGSSDSGASLGDILGAALSKAKKGGKKEDATE